MSTNPNHGWVPDWDHTRQFAAENPHPLFAATAQKMIRDTTKKDTFLWRPLIQTLKSLDQSYSWKAQYQKRGTCVGQGWKLIADTLEAIQHVFNGTKWLGRCSVAGMYAGGRVDIAGQPGHWDGSSGSYVAKWITKFGMLMLKDIGLPEDARDDDEQLAVKWTASRDGVPTEYETASRRFPIRTASLVTNFEDAAIAIQNGYPIAHCSGLIPAGRKGSDGFAALTGRGGHCEVFWGVRWDKPGLYNQNSWDTSWCPGGKYVEDDPGGGCWLSANDCDKILRQGDSYAISHADGFERQKLNFRLI